MPVAVPEPFAVREPKDRRVDRRVKMKDRINDHKRQAEEITIFCVTDLTALFFFFFCSLLSLIVVQDRHSTLRLRKTAKRLRLS